MSGLGSKIYAERCARAMVQVGDHDPEPTDGGFYANTHWMVGEIVLAEQILQRKVADLRDRNNEKTAVGQKFAAEEVARIAGQLKACAEVIARASAQYLNRRPRP